MRLEEEVKNGLLLIIPFYFHILCNAGTKFLDRPFEGNGDSYIFYLYSRFGLMRHPTTKNM